MPTTTLVSLQNGAPLLARAITDERNIYFCGTTPAARDSSLATDGVVLYVMLQRAIATGASVLGNTRQLIAGESAIEVDFAFNVDARVRVERRV